MAPPRISSASLGRERGGQAKTFVTFDAPGATGGTYPSSINPAGAITGSYYVSSDTRGGHGFLRASNGTFTTFDAPGASVGTTPTSINPAGTITGYFHGGFSINPAGAITGSYADASNMSHGFLRSPGGGLGRD